MTRRELISCGLIFAVVVAAYAVALDRSFVSEDFCALRILRADPPWNDLSTFVTSPLLGIVFIKFYRPVAVFLLALEVHLWGVWPPAYNLTHLVVHAGNAGLVYVLSRLLLARVGRDDRVGPLVAALLFAIYPLHPNSVIFIAGFATLFGATFFLLGAICYLRAQETGRRRDLAASVVAFLLAIGSYENAVVLPVVIVAGDFLFGDRRLRTLCRRTNLQRYALYLVPLAGYFLLRKHLFGVFIGGYEDVSQRVLSSQILFVVRDVLRSLVRLINPNYALPNGTWVDIGFLGLGLVVPLAYSAVVFWRGERRTLMLEAFCILWIFVMLAPFAFVPAVPATGRYWYLASVGLALHLGLVAFGMIPRRQLLRVVALAGVAALLAYYAVLLTDNLRGYRRAGQTTAAIQAQIESLSPGESDAPLFVADYPLFVRNNRGVPISQVFHWCLHDAVNPPFTDRRIDAYPLGLIGTDIVTPLRRSGHAGSVYRWNGARQSMEPAARPDADDALAGIDVISPADGSEVPLTPAGVRVAFRSAGYPRLRLMVVTRANSGPMNLASIPQGGEPQEHEAYIPYDFLHFVRTHYGGTVFWWVEGRDLHDQLLAVSPLRLIHIAPL